MNRNFFGLTEKKTFKRRYRFVKEHGNKKYSSDKEGDYRT